MILSMMVPLRAFIRSGQKQNFARVGRIFLHAQSKILLKKELNFAYLVPQYLPLTKKNRDP